MFLSKKILGVDEHISVKVKKANAIAGLIRRTFSYFHGPLFNMNTTFKKKYKTILRNMQRRATKLVDGFHHIRYSERLKN